MLRRKFEGSCAYRRCLDAFARAALRIIICSCLGASIAARGEFEVTVPATVEWLNTGVYVKPGDVVSFTTVQGKWLNTADSQNLVGPGGFGDYIHDGTVNSKATLASLIARIGPTMADSFQVGVPTNGQPFNHRSRAEGTLFLAMNDVPGTYGDNQGSMNVSFRTSSRWMPDLVGMDPRDALVLLRRMDANLRFDPNREFSDVSAGKVSSQSPLPGSRVGAGDENIARISDGPAPPPPQILLPDLRGMTPEAAEDLLRNKFGRRINRPPEHGYSDFPAGRISTQKPPPNTPIGNVKLVVVQVSDGPEPPARVHVPDVVGMDEKSAVEIIRKAGLTPRRIADAVLSPQKRGTVVSTDPTEDTPVSPSSAVGYSLAPGRNRVPDVRGLPVEKAGAQIEEAGFRAGSVATVEDEQLLNLVKSTNPEGNEVAEIGTAVDFTVGTDRIEIPDVRGSSQGDAERALIRAGFRPVVTADFSVSMPGVVHDQYPVGEGRRGDVVELRVSLFVWVIVLPIAGLAAGAAALWPRVKVSVEAPRVKSGTDEPVDSAKTADEISFSIEILPGRQPDESSARITKEEKK